MVYFSNAQETSNLFGGYIEQVQQALAAHHVPFGSPADFPAFAETLETDSRLRSDLAVLARSFVTGDENVSLRTLLSILSVASGGPDLAASDGDMSQPVSVLVDFLISLGLSKPASAENTAGAENPDSPSHQTHPMPYRVELSEEGTYQPYLPPPPSLDRHSLPHQTPPAQMIHDETLPDQTLPNHILLDQTLPDSFGDDDQSPLETAPTLPSLNPLPHPTAESSLVESIARLEFNSLQVKHYLDSIDQRISRIEPRLDHLPTHVLPATPPQFGHAAEARYSSVLASEALPNEPPPDESLPPAPPTQPTKPPEAFSKPPELLPHREPPQQQVSSRSKILIPLTTAAATALLVSLLHWGFGRNTSSITIQPAPAPAAENRTPTPTNPLPRVGEVNTSSLPQSATAPPAQNATAAAPTLTTKTGASSPSHSTPLRRSASASPTSTTTHPSTPTQGTRVELPKPSAASLASPEDSTPPFTLTEPVNVSSGIMAANVLSAPQPSYPKLASLTRMQGPVVMQAIISKEGTIEDVHVIKGHRLLRGAATNAVRTWRYRPYLINGQPVQVATTVSVDFKLH
jgi:TonB family protein